MTLKTERRKRSGNSGGSREPFTPKRSERRCRFILFHRSTRGSITLRTRKVEYSRGILSSTPLTDSYGGDRYRLFPRILRDKETKYIYDIHILASGNRFLSSFFSFYFPFLSRVNPASSRFSHMHTSTLGNNETRACTDSMITRSNIPWQLFNLSTGISTTAVRFSLPNIKIFPSYHRTPFVPQYRSNTPLLCNGEQIEVWQDAYRPVASVNFKREKVNEQRT